MKSYNTIISACLLGLPCRYNGKGKLNEKAVKIFLNGKSLAVCPEIAAGLKTPRPACEISGGNGFKVLNGKAKVIDEQGNDYSKEFIKGAEIVAGLIKKHNIGKAILKSGSPSCGVKNVYSGKFNGEKTKGCGVLAALARKNGVKRIIEM